MRKAVSFLYIATFLSIGGVPALAGQTTLTTYYPAPDGNYNHLTANNVGIAQAIGVDVLDITGNTVDIGNITAQTNGAGIPGNVIATGYVKGDIVTATGAAASSTAAAGAYLFYNQGGGGEADLIGNKGVGAGGFTFYSAPGPTSIATMDAYGRLNLGTVAPAGGAGPFLKVIAPGGYGSEAIRAQSASTFFTSLDATGTPRMAINNDTVAGAPVLNFYGSDTGFFNFMTVNNSGSKYVSFDAGNVGIGIATPAQLLEVNGIAQVDNTIYANGGASLGQGAARQALWFGAAADCNHAMYNNLNTPCGHSLPIPAPLPGNGSNDLEYVDYFNGLIFQPTNPVGTPSYFDSGGNFTTGSNPLRFTSAWDNFAGGNNSEISNDTGSFKTLMIVGNTSAGGSRSVSVWDILTVNGTETITGNLQVNGSINANGTVTGLGTSDRRLKQNIVPLTDTLSKLDQLRGVSFEWNHLAASIGHKEGEKNIGMIAQEMQKVYPELVGSSKYGKQEYLAIDYSKFTAVLLQSIKELKSEMNTMQDQINVLQEKVNTLEKQK